jgi:hypothetical protein
VYLFAFALLAPHGLLRAHAQRLALVGQVARADGVLGARGIGWGGWQLPVPLEVLVLKLWQRWEVEVGFRWMKSGFGLGEKP